MANGNEEHYLTQEKYEDLSKELEHLKTTKRKEIAENLEYARSLGDISENAEYQEAREMQAATEERIRELEATLKSAKIVAHTKGDVVGMGSVVEVKRAGEQETHQYEIVGTDEANMRERKISHRSPLGEALMGKKKGETFSFDTPNGKVECSIVNVE